MQSWHLDIRDLSLKIYLLFPNGSPSQEIAELMEELFQLAKRKKEGENNDELSEKMRDTTRNVRQALARDLHSSE